MLKSVCRDLWLLLEDISESILGKEKGLCVCWAARVRVCAT